MEYDVLTRGGVVVDGIGAPRFRADVAIKDRKVPELTVQAGLAWIS
jgi:N-acyl-D-aspartate/D-glutamate deacylase